MRDLRVVGERSVSSISHFDRDACLDFVHVLTAGTTGARGGGAEQVRGHDDAVAEGEVAHGYCQTPNGCGGWLR